MNVFYSDRIFFFFLKKEGKEKKEREKKKREWEQVREEKKEREREKKKNPCLDKNQTFSILIRFWLHLFFTFLAVLPFPAVSSWNHRLCCFLAWNCVGAFYFLCTLFIRVVPFVKEGRATFQDMVTKQIVFWCCLDYRPCCFTVRCVCSCAARLLLHCPSIWLLLFNMYLLCIHICIYKYMHPQIHNVRFIFCWTDLVGYAFISSV